MTTLARPPLAAPDQLRREPRGRLIIKLLTTTDHKTIGYMYLVTTFAWFLIGGVLALLLRSELARPGLQFFSTDQYNQIFTMHGTIMLLMFATPLFIGFTNVIMPLQIGAADVAFPRMNMLSYWLYLFGGIMAFAGFLTPGGAASFGWTAYAPLASSTYSPGLGGDLWVVGLAIGGVGTILGGVNFITTIVVMRAPGMTMFRMSIFTWNALLTSILVLLAFPPLAAALLGLEADRRFGAHIFDPANGGAMLWQHLFWFFGHPEVYILALPFFGIATEILPVFSRKPDLWLQGLSCRNHFNFRSFRSGVGAPHVRDWRSTAALLLIHDISDRRSYWREIL
jgi:cytochrome c oxidase subunit 1